MNFLKLFKLKPETPKYRNPVPTVDAIIFVGDPKARSIVLIKRKNPPYGWALPGGFVNYGESFEAAVAREALEETGLKIKLLGQLGTYSDPERDPRSHIVTTVFAASARDQTPVAADDAAEIVVVPIQEAVSKYTLAFDHKKILEDFMYLVKDAL